MYLAVCCWISEKACLGSPRSVVVYVQPKRLASKWEEARAVYSGKPNANAIKDFVGDKS